MKNNNNSNSIHKSLERGKEYFQNGEYSRALNEFKDVLLNDPFCEEAMKLADKAMNIITHLEAQIIVVTQTQRVVKKPSEKQTVKQKPDKVPAAVKPDSTQTPDTGKAEILKVKGEEITAQKPKQERIVPDKEESGEKEKSPGIDSMIDTSITAGQTAQAGDALRLKKSTGQEPVTGEIFDKGFNAYRQGNLAEAYNLFISVLKKNPTHKEAQRYCKITREILKKRYLEKLGSPARIPVLQNIGPGDIKKLSLTPDENYLLSRIDGQATFKQLFYVSQMDVFDTGRFFVHLLENGLLKIK